VKGRDSRPPREGGPSRDGRPTREGGPSRDGRATRGRGSANPASRSNAPVSTPPRPAAEDRPARVRKPAPKRAPPAIAGSGGAGGTVDAAPEGPMRVQRAVARAGLASRREADRAVAEGRVLVNGVVAVIGQVVDASRDVITLDGDAVRVNLQQHRWIVLHKPAAVMTTRKDPGGRATVFDLVHKVPGLVYVGRLDYMTEGVLLLTTDGRAAHALTHPSREVERTYVATVRGDAATAVREARHGVQLEDGLVVPRDVLATPLGNRRWAFQVTIAEGKTHEVRRMCDALGLEVERLVRTQFGPVKLGDLEVGQTRALTTKERAVLDALVPSASR